MKVAVIFLSFSA